MTCQNVPDMNKWIKVYNGEGWIASTIHHNQNHEYIILFTRENGLPVPYVT